LTFPVLEGKVAIVTGAAMGMDLATAKLFAKAGAKAVVADMNEEKGRSALAEIEAAGRSGAGESMVGFGYVFVCDGDDAACGGGVHEPLRSKSKDQSGKFKPAP